MWKSIYTGNEIHKNILDIFKFGKKYFVDVLLIFA